MRPDMARVVPLRAIYRSEKVNPVFTMAPTKRYRGMLKLDSPAQNARLLLPVFGWG
jgi:hypothetical protein